MKRREFAALIGGFAIVWPLASLAQQPTIGWLYLGWDDDDIRPIVEAFRSGLADLGYTESKNIRLLYRYADGHAERLSALTIELVSLGATCIVTTGTTAIRAVHTAAPNVPIVTWGGADPLVMGWAQTLARPGGMITGVFGINTIPKYFELLKEVLPQATTFGYLINATNPIHALEGRKVVDYAARTLGINVEIIGVKEPSEFADAFDRMRARGVAGVAINPDPVFGAKAEMIAELARMHMFATVRESASFLFSFENDYVGMVKRSASYVDQILKGAAPGDLAMEQGKVFRLLVNLKAAKELGLTIPPSVFARADEVIE
jgi:putative ABC transport system substrate-binding protein